MRLYLEIPLLAPSMLCTWLEMEMKCWNWRLFYFILFWVKGNIC